MYRVVYIDDEEDLLEITKKFLEYSKEFTVDTWISAQDALDCSDISSYDAIVSDYQMPGMNGIRFLQEVRARFGNIPFILFSGRGREEVVIEALNGGADFYLQKGGDPVSQFAELTHKIRIAVEHRKTEEGLVIQNRLYSVLSATNKAIVHTRNKQDLFTEICRILVTIGGFRMAWIGLADTAVKKVIPVASFGHIHGYLDTIDVSTVDISHGCGPTGAAYREGKHIFSNDISTDPIMAQWRQPALERGYQANAGFPFALGTRNAGVITVYSSKKGYFDERIIDLLSEMARDISFALKTIDEQEKRELAETALGESQERFSKLFDHMIDGIAVHELIYDPTGTPTDYRILEVNSSFEKILGIDKESIIGKTSCEAYLVDDPPYFEIYSRVATDGEPYSFETFFPGMNKHFYISVYSFQKGFFTTIFKDISDQKKNELELIRKNEEIFSAFEELTATEEELRQNLAEITKTHLALKESEEKYRRIVDTANEGIWALDKDLRTTFVNQRVLDMLGYSSGEILGEYIYSFMPEEDLADHWQRIYHRKQGKPGRYERRFRCRDGTIVWTLISATPLIDDNGDFYGSFAMITDISGIKHTEEKLNHANEELSTAFEELTAAEEELRQNLNEITKNQRALKESEEKYRLIVDAAQEGICVMDRDLVTTFMNQRLAEILGYDREELLGKSIFLFMPDEDLEDQRKIIEERKQGKPGKYERRFRCRDGTIVWALISATPLLDDKGNFSGSFAMITDISGIKRIEHAFRQANQQLNILGGITRHDILNKVSVLLGYAALAKKTTSDPDMRAFIDKVEAATNAIKSQIEFTRLYQDLGSHEPQWQKISKILPSRNESLQVILHNAVNGVEIFADPMLEKVFSNLLDNSLRHGQHVTEIRISSGESDEGLTLIWEDNGAGIAAGEKERIFERGYGKNTGLGLFLVREILFLTGITIREDGTEGKGARFTIIVPKDAYRMAV